MAEYDLFADIYDVDLGKVDRDLKMYSELITGKEKVLVLTCGTGREIEYLSDFCDEIYGVDISENMLKKANEKVKEKTNVKLILGDMKNIKLECKFDAILIPNNGILHLLKLEDIEECLNNCKEYLKDDGRIFLDFFVPDYNVLATNTKTKIHDFTKYDEELEMYITRERVHLKDVFNKICLTQIFYEFCDLNGNSKKHICQYKIRYLFVDEFELLIRLVGLKRVNRYGNFNFEEYGAEHYNVVYEIKK